jgi:hypothetical protein
MFLNKICDIDAPLIRGGNPTPAAALALQSRRYEEVGMARIGWRGVFPAVTTRPGVKPAVE